MSIFKKTILLIASLFLIISNTIYGNSSIFNSEINIIAGYSDIHGFISKSMMLKNSIGVEYFRKFSGDYRDYLTFDLQSRLTYDFDKKFRKAFALEIHNAWGEYKIAYGYNLRLGHFDIPFGLEPIVDTHGTIFQTLAQKNIGTKQDWGIQLNGAKQYFDYALSLSLGSGMGINSKDGSYIFSGRIGLPQEKNFVAGLSLLTGKVLLSMDMNTIPKPMYIGSMDMKRIGLDAQYLSGPFLIKSELTYGKNKQINVGGAMIETDFTVPSYQSIKFEIQNQFFQSDLADMNSRDMTIAFGLNYKVTSYLTTRIAYFYDIYSMDLEKDSQILGQIYILK